MNMETFAKAIERCFLGVGDDLRPGQIMAEGSRPVRQFNLVGEGDDAERRLEENFSEFINAETKPNPSNMIIRWRQRPCSTIYFEGGKRHVAVYWSYALIPAEERVA